MKKYLYLLVIITIGLILRLIFIDKPDGLWNDEYVSWMIASAPFSEGFWTGVKNQCHMPIYYLYLKAFINIFGNNDTLLRLSSVLPGIIAIPVLYSIGDLKDKKTGYFCAFFAAISSFLIYYSQEVRIYSLLFLISSLSLLYTLKLLKTTNIKNLLLYILFNFLILVTHTIGFVYVFFNLYKNYKKQVSALWISLALCTLIVSPLIIKILTFKSFSQWWGHFSFSKIVFLFTDYFSPVLTNLTNAPDNIFYMPSLALFMLLPAIIAITCIVISLHKNRQNCELATICLLVILTLSIASLSGKLVFITKYSIEIYPILIYLACFGITQISNKVLRIVLICVYCFISLGYIFIHPYSAPKMRRAEGHKLAIDMLKRADPQPNDYIIILYYSKDRFLKYFDFSKYNVISMDKSNFREFLSEESYNENNQQNCKSFYKNTFFKQENAYFENLLSKNVLNNLQNNQNVIVIVLDSVSVYSPNDMQKISQNEALYNKTPFLFLVFSYLRNETFEYMVKSLVVTQIERKGKWTVARFTKLNNQ